MFLSRLFAAGIAALVVGMIAPAIADDPQPSARAITCTNPYSGATWEIRIDYGKGTVDSNPARIGDAKIFWHNAADGGNYTLDRKTGDLRIVVASSTGGYFLNDHCKLDN